MGRGKQCHQPGPLRGHDLHQLSGVRETWAVRSSRGAPRPECPKSYLPPRLTLLPLLTRQLREDMNLITEGARRFHGSGSQSGCLLSNSALSLEPAGSLNRSQTATALGTQGQRRTRTSYIPPPRDPLHGAGVSEAESRTGRASPRRKVGEWRAALAAQALGTSGPAWHSSMTGSPLPEGHKPQRSVKRPKAST